MKVLVDVCVIPLGIGVSVSGYVVACQRVFEQAGVDSQMHAYGTNVEGDWDVVMAAIKQCHQVVHQMGAPRISTTIRLGTRTDRQQTMQEKIQSVEQKMNSGA